MHKWTLEEQETTINYDYFEKVVYIQTTQQSVFKSLVKKCLNIEGAVIDDKEMQVIIPMDKTRKPHSVFKGKGKSKGNPNWIKSKPINHYLQQPETTIDCEKASIPVEDVED